MIKLEQISYRAVLNTTDKTAVIHFKVVKPPIQIDRVLYINGSGSTVTDTYSKAEINNFMNNKLDIPTQSEWDNFQLTLQG